MLLSGVAPVVAHCDTPCLGCPRVDAIGVTDADVAIVHVGSFVSSVTSARQLLTLMSVVGSVLLNCRCRGRRSRRRHRRRHRCSFFLYSCC